MRTLAWCVVVCVLAAGCAPDEPDDGGPSSSASVPTSPPPVSRQLDPSAYGTEDTVCDLLTDDQAVALDLPRTGNPDERTDTIFQCLREKEHNERWTVAYTLWLNVDLPGEWHGRGDDDYELRDIEGQPGLVKESEDGQFCNLAVRLAEQKSLQVLTSSGPDEKACSLVIPVAEQIVRNIKG